MAVDPEEHVAAWKPDNAALARMRTAEDNSWKVNLNPEAANLTLNVPAEESPATDRNLG